jgi:hypothetical protein
MQPTTAAARWSSGRRLRLGEDASFAPAVAAPRQRQQLLPVSSSNSSPSAPRLLIRSQEWEKFHLELDEEEDDPREEDEAAMTREGKREAPHQRRPQ